MKGIGLLLLSSVLGRPMTVWWMPLSLPQTFCLGGSFTEVSSSVASLMEQ